MAYERNTPPMHLTKAHPEPHKPERGMIACTMHNETILPSYQRQEGPYLVTYWNAPVRLPADAESYIIERNGEQIRISDTFLHIDLTLCVAAWVLSTKDSAA